MNNFLLFDFFPRVIIAHHDAMSPDSFFFSLVGSMAVLFFLLSAAITVIKGK